MPPQFPEARLPSPGLPRVFLPRVFAFIPKTPLRFIGLSWLEEFCLSAKWQIFSFSFAGRTAASPSDLALSQYLTASNSILPLEKNLLKIRFLVLIRLLRIFKGTSLLRQRCSCSAAPAMFDDLLKVQNVVSEKRIQRLASGGFSSATPRASWPIGSAYLKRMLLRRLGNRLRLPKITGIVFGRPRHCLGETS